MPEFAKRMDCMSGSAEIIRGLFGAVNDPEIISFSAQQLSALIKSKLYG